MTSNSGQLATIAPTQRGKSRENFVHSRTKAAATALVGALAIAATNGGGSRNQPSTTVSSTRPAKPVPRPLTDPPGACSLRIVLSPCAIAIVLRSLTRYALLVRGLAG